MNATEMVMAMITNRIVSLKEEIDTLKMALEDKEDELNKLTKYIEKRKNDED